MTKTVAVKVEDLEYIAHMLECYGSVGALGRARSYIPKPRPVARFTLLDHGVEASGVNVNLTAEEWGRSTYGKRTVARLQDEIDADPESHSTGEVHSTIPDNTNGARDTYGRRYSVLIASIEDE